MRSTSRLRAWLDDRMGLQYLVDWTKKEACKTVPTRLSWVYTLGTLALFFFFLQFVSGFLLLMRYSPHPDVAFQTVQTIQHKAHYGWLIRQMHSWGASFIVVVLILHMLKVLWYGSYKRPREFTWFVGVLLFLVTLGFSLTGYILPWNQVAKWATAVVTAGIASTPGVGEQLYEMIVGGTSVSGNTVGRFFAVHVFLLPVFFGILVLGHLVLIRWKGVAPKLRVDEELELGYEGALEKVGHESFFPRQIYRELLIMILGFALLVTFATFFPWELGEPASRTTPSGVKPEWYFLPVYQAIKYFDEALVSSIPVIGSMNLVNPEFVGIVFVNLFVVVLLFLPILDFGKERKITRRPIFATLAFLSIVGVLVLGVLGELSNNTYQVFGKEITFSTKAAWEIRDLPDEETKNDSPEAEQPGSAEESPAEIVSDVPKWAAPDLTAATREDGLPLGGTCGSSDCHRRQHRLWIGSIHAVNTIECVKCHGGHDTDPGYDNAAEDYEDKLEAFAHEGMLQNEDGEPREPETDAEIIDICGGCHIGVREVFAARHTEGDSTKNCYNCHSNHKVVPVSLATFKKGYHDEADPRTEDFERIEALIKEWIETSRPAALADIQEGIDQLAEHEYPVGELETQLEEVQQTVSESDREIATLTHSLDPQEVSKAIAKAHAEVGKDLRESVAEKLVAIENRWHVVAGVWAVTLIFSALLILKLRGFSRQDRAAAVTPVNLGPLLEPEGVVEHDTVADAPLDVGLAPLEPFVEEETLSDRPLDSGIRGVETETESESESESEADSEAESESEPDEESDPDSDPDDQRRDAF